jgi:adenine-specific DNA-methyltransferase
MLQTSLAPARYTIVPDDKADGATYTPKILADFVASKIVETFNDFPVDRPLRVLDPAVGDGVLLISLLEQLGVRQGLNIEVYGFETNQKVLNIASARIKQRFPAVAVHFEKENFLEFVLEYFGTGNNVSLFKPDVPESYDLIIANPPYVRTQIMGASQTQALASQFGLSGRVDLYYAFLLGMARVLKPHGSAGIIVSNRFMTTRSGAPVRQAILERFNLCKIWDFGDTKLFDAAVLPAVLLAKGKNGYKNDIPQFTSIYETQESSETEASTPIRAVLHSGVVRIDDGRHFFVQHGKLNINDTPDGVWRIATNESNSWLAKVKSNTWGTFGDIGKIRVGVKTCADKVFIRSDWTNMPENQRPELLRPLITHHVARRFKALTSSHSPQILYPHEVVRGQRCSVDLSLYPRSKAYLTQHRKNLAARKYVVEANRKWYELWVPQDPTAWEQPKLVFRDIAKEPTFWIDQDGSVVNGDCYWIICRNPAQTDLLWLAAAVANSRFIERFYDTQFHNKLYAGRRRFITQYVEKFPLPDPNSALSKEIIDKTKKIFADIDSLHSATLQKELERMVWKAFGLIFEKVSR